MSEYQYYEWQTHDRALTAAEQAAVAELSSHIDVSTTGAWIEYHWGDFKHDPLQVLAQHFDAFLYYANWGSQRLAFRFPKGLLHEDALAPYLWGECTTLMPAGDVLILDIAYPEDGGGNGFEGEAQLSTLAPLRDDLLDGDYRTLYLAWLLEASSYGMDEDLEPPIPPGLGELSAPLTAFVHFFQLDPYVVMAAARASVPLEPAPALELASLIPRLPRPECDDFLRRLAEGEPLLALKLNRRLQELAGRSPAPEPAAPHRTWGEIYAAAAQLRHGK